MFATRLWTQRSDDPILKKIDQEVEMRLSYEEIEKLALDLDARDRRRLLDSLADGLAADEAPLHRVDPLEILERIRRLENGETELLDADEVLADAWRRLAR